MACNWHEIRANAIARGRLDPHRARAASRKMHNAIPFPA